MYRGEERQDGMSSRKEDREVSHHATSIGNAPGESATSNICYTRNLIGDGVAVQLISYTWLSRLLICILSSLSPSFTPFTSK
jgi:hypothetical protein